MMDVRELDERVSDAFQGGEILRREVRLTDEEADFLRRERRARVRDMTGGWYEVAFWGVKHDGT